ncbi:MAG: hypothetical protein M0023_00370 [Desulfobacteraceae bacterium]|nr:hypothetical protein [Desulfobacteraceae bacterium]
MIIAALILKPIAWLVAFRFGTRDSMDAMMLSAAGITVFLTLADAVSVASNLAYPAIILTLVLYTLMSFTLIPLAWKVNNSICSVVLNLAGMVGACAGVNFTMDFLRTLLPSINRL